MATKYDKVIIFGPTGAVGSYAALEAQKRGAHVYLAMRDPSKPISVLKDAESKNPNSFTRIKADLTDLASLTAAIKGSGCKAAYVYLIHGPHPMNPTFRTLKEAGVEHIVFLSSFTCRPQQPLRSIPPSDLIPFVHARAEIALEDLGINHVALRPASFASNLYKMGTDVSKSPKEVQIYGSGSRKMDNIVPADIGRVGGAVLVDPPYHETESIDRLPSENPQIKKHVIYLYGPSLSTELETAELIASHSNGDIKVVKQNPDEWLAAMKAKGVPPPIAEYLAKVQSEPHDHLFASDLQKKGTENVGKYTGGGQATGMEEFVREWRWE